MLWIKRNSVWRRPLDLHGASVRLFEGIAWLMWNESRNDGLSAQANASILWASTTAGTVTGGVIGHYLGAAGRGLDG